MRRDRRLELTDRVTSIAARVRPGRGREGAADEQHASRDREDEPIRRSRSDSGRHRAVSSAAPRRASTVRPRARATREQQVRQHESGDRDGVDRDRAERRLGERRRGRRQQREPPVAPRQACANRRAASHATSVITIVRNATTRFENSMNEW